MANRRRVLSAEERALWQQIAESATPLPPTATPPPPQPARPPTPASAPRSASPARKPGPAARGGISFDLAPELGALLARAHPHMDRRRLDKLRRGRMEPQARLDLHGLTAARAHVLLSDFILRAHGGGLRLVLVITGKGRLDDDGYHAPRQGVLRHNVPHWLTAPPLGGRVLQVTTAHAKHGGAGAYYVYLRRQR